MGQRSVVFGDLFQPQERLASRYSLPMALLLGSNTWQVIFEVWASMA